MPRTGPEPRRARARQTSVVPAPAESPIRYFVSDEGGPVTALSPEAAPALDAAARNARNRLIDWHPPEEDGDDAPILRGARPPQPAVVRPSEAATVPAPTPAHAAAAAFVPLAPPGATVDAVTLEADRDDGGAGDPAANPRDYSEIFVDVGRREGVKPADLQRVLRDRGGISRRETGRIRVRDKHTFVSVRKDVFERALQALSGVEFAGRTSRAEPAREGAGEGRPDA